LGVVPAVVLVRMASSIPAATTLEQLENVAVQSQKTQVAVASIGVIPK